MKKWLNRFLNDERGNVLVLVALLLVVLIGFTALVVDGGRLYVEKSMLQKAADAAALAGVQELPYDKAMAEIKAKEVANKNDVTNTTVEIPADNMSIRVTTSSNVNLTFARVFGNDSAEVTAKAKVELNTVTSGTGVIPIGVDINDYDNWKNCTEITLKLEKPSNNNGNNGNGNNGNNGSNEKQVCNGSNNLGSGNTGAIRILDNKGGNDYKNDLGYGSEFPVSVGDIFFTEPGVMKGPNEDGIEIRVNSCSEKYEYKSATFLTNPPPSDCGQVVTVPMYSILDVFENGTMEVKIEGFATFFLIGSGNGKEAIGRFMNFITASDASAGLTNNGSTGLTSGTYVYKLVE